METRVVLVEEDVPGEKLAKNPEECSVIELKRWLECHGLKKGGRKSELVERVSQSRGLIKVDPKVDGGKWYELKLRGTIPCTSKEFSEPLTPIGGWRNFPGSTVPSMFKDTVKVPNVFPDL